MTSVSESKYQSIELPTEISVGFISVQPLSTADLDSTFKKSPSTPANIAKGLETADALFAMLAGRLRAGTFGVNDFDADKVSPLLVCSPDDNIIDVFRRMISRDVFAVPVIAAANLQCTGFIDMWDIARYIMQHFGKQRLGREQSFWDLLTEEYKFQDRSVHELQRHHQSDKRQDFSVTATYSLFTVCDVMVQERVRCIPVMRSNQDKQLMNLITQSQVIHWLDKHRELIGIKSAMKLSAFPDMFKPVLTITNEQTAMDAFDLMAKNQVSGVAVVNEAGHLIENISVRDLKIIGADASMFYRMQQTVLEFTHELDVHYKHKIKCPRQVVYVTPRAMIQDVIHWFVLFRIHRVYIVDNHIDKKPIGVCSIRGLLQQIITP